ncbi:uncharacterized protein Dana_GF26358 [Drosophila ananassae]|uniref:Uncharacterized protein n=1 Tax=Drosophila ananassae TaxID=7217 RepID=A0A0P9BMA0_DROAN|nr:uncharacterized protein Dana_GF26358 [Drosophila ananassae]
MLASGISSSCTAKTTTTTASSSSQPPSSPSLHAHPDHAAPKAAKDISPTRAKCLAAFEQFIKARTFTDPADTVSLGLPPAGRLVRNLQASTSPGTAAEKKI